MALAESSVKGAEFWYRNLTERLPSQIKIGHFDFCINIFWLRRNLASKCFWMVWHCFSCSISFRLYFSLLTSTQAKLSFQTTARGCPLPCEAIELHSEVCRIVSSRWLPVLSPVCSGNDLCRSSCSTILSETRQGQSMQYCWFLWPVAWKP